MRFWQRIFCSMLFIFIIVFDFAVYALVSYACNFNMERETKNAIHEQSLIQSSIQKNLEGFAAYFPDVSQDKERLKAILEPLADYYKDQDVFLALYDGDKEVYSNLVNGDDIDPKLFQINGEGDKLVKNQRINDARYLFVTSMVPSFSNLTFVYSRDISQIDYFRYRISLVFIIVSVMVCIVLGLVIFLILKRLTHPLTHLNDTTREIARGAYDRRVDIKRNDELGELGCTFNQMADSVEEKMRQLVKSAEYKQQFIDNLAHELKTPITAILGYSEYLQKAVSNDEQRRIATGHLHDAAERIKNLLTKLLDVAYLRDEAMEWTEVDVESLFNTLWNLTSLELKENKVNLKIDSQLNSLNGDETLLLSLLVNLVSNAIRASKEGRFIIIQAYKDPYPILEVKDEGCGMNEEEIEKITEPFYRVDKSRSRKNGGVGLGLSIVAGIVGLHEAKLEIQSQLGKGTTVRVVFLNQ